MKLNLLLIGLFTSAVVGVAAVSAAEIVGARMAVFIEGDDIGSNQILFDYAKAMNLAAIEALGKAYPGSAVPFAELIKKLPEPLSGWTGDEPEGGQITVPGLSYSFAQRDYHKSGAEDDVSVIIYDTMEQQAGPWYGVWAGWGFSWETTEGYARSTTVSGYPAWETRDYKDNSGVLAIGLVLAPVPEAGMMALATLISAGLVASWGFPKSKS